MAIAKHTAYALIAPSAQSQLALSYDLFGGQPLSAVQAQSAGPWLLRSALCARPKPHRFCLPLHTLVSPTGKVAARAAPETEQQQDHADTTATASTPPKPSNVSPPSVRPKRPSTPANATTAAIVTAWLSIGFSGPITLQSTGYPNLAEARLAGIEELLRRLNAGTGEKATDRAMVDQLRDALRQPGLFDFVI